MDHIQGAVFLFHVLLSEPFNRPSGINEVFGLNSGSWPSFRMKNIWLLIQSGVPCATAPGLLLSHATRRKNKPKPNTRNRTRLCITARWTPYAIFVRLMQKAGSWREIIIWVILQKAREVQRHSWALTLQTSSFLQTARHGCSFLQEATN